MAVLLAIRDSQWAALSSLLELILALERLDEGLLGQILGVGDVADDPVDEQEDSP